MIAASTGRHPVLTFLSWQAVGLALLFCHVGLAVLLGTVTPSYVFIVPVVTLLYIADSLAGFAVFLQFLMYQNLAISMASASFDFDLYHGMQGISFALTLAMSTVAVCRLWAAQRDRGALVIIAAIGAVILAYAAFGAVQSSVGSAAVYFRSSIVGILGLLVGWDVGREHGYRDVGVCYLISMVLGVAVVVCEAAVPLAYYEWIDAQNYYRLKYSTATSNPDLDFRSAQDVLAYLSRSFFNLVGEGMETVRFGGPNMHSVSYAYVMSIGAIVAVSLGTYWFAALLLPLIVLIGVKGAAITLVAAVTLWSIGRAFGGPALVVIGAISGMGFVALVISYGLSVGDYHVIGLMGGIDGFLRNPMGHGIGVGGNLSSSVTSTDLAVDWNSFQRYGADQALESAIGVLLYQMGIGAIAVLYGLWIPFRALIGDFRRPAGLVALALAAVAVNGLFQEEAFSPYALGILTFFAGVLSSHRIGTAPSVAKEPRLAPVA
jgi:hypothetical protein